MSKELSRRQQGQAAGVLKVSWEAQNRLHRQFTHLAARKMHRNKVLVAVARELTAFIWEALRELPCYQPQQKAP